MNTISAYLFRQALGPLLAILGALAAVAILTQGLNQLDIIITNREAGFAFVWVTLLSLPQLISLILPLALFFAVLYALNRMHSESEIITMYGAGMSRGRIARPILQLALLAALGHLAINTLIQPAALGARRDVYYALRTDIASSLVREGSFTFPSPDLTLYARERGGGGEMHDMMINDARPQFPVTYTARTGAIVMIDGAPAIVMRDGQVQRQVADGTVDVLDFDRYVLQLGHFFDEPDVFYLKASDRYLYNLFFPDRTAYYDQRNLSRFRAGGRDGGDVRRFSRRGYARRMMLASGAALAVRLLELAINAACIEKPQLNPLQYALPIAAALVAALIIGGKSPRRRRREAAPSLAVRA